jgi:hypothetical protein
MANMIPILPASFPRDLDDIRRLFQAYADGLGIDLGFQGFAEELATLPRKYAHLRGGHCLHGATPRP